MTGSGLEYETLLRGNCLRGTVSNETLLQGGCLTGVKTRFSLSHRKHAGLVRGLVQPFSVHFPHILASGKLRAAMLGKCTFFCMCGTRFSAHFPRIAASRRAIPPYPCMKFFGCSDMREMYVFLHAPPPEVQRYAGNELFPAGVVSRQCRDWREVYGKSPFLRHFSRGTVSFTRPWRPCRANRRGSSRASCARSARLSWGCGRPRARASSACRPGALPRSG